MSDVVGAPGKGSIGLCVVCGETFFKLMFHSYTEEVDPKMSTVKIAGIGECALHEECAVLLEGCGGDWAKLPDGPLRKGYEAAMKGDGMGTPEAG